MTTDPNYIGTVTLMNGEKITLKMPKMKQVYLDLLINRKPWLEVIIPATTGKTWEWYLELSLVDGGAILMVLSPAIEALGNTMKALSPPETKH